jgi:N-acetylneuraminic acid mutarotase
MLPDLPVPLYGLACTYLRGGGVIVCGGCQTNSQTSHQTPATVVSTAYVLKPGHMSWVRVANMPRARTGGMAVTLQDGRVVVMGGRTDTQGCTAGVDAFDPTDNTWQELAPMSQAKKSFGESHAAEVVARAPLDGLQPSNTHIGQC